MIIIQLFGLEIVDLYCLCEPEFYFRRVGKNKKCSVNFFFTKKLENYVIFEKNLKNLSFLCLQFDFEFYSSDNQTTLIQNELILSCAKEKKPFSFMLFFFF
jgi:hypothetical protein